MFYIKGMIISPTVKQYVDTLTANGYSENRIKELCIIYNEESLKHMALAPDGILWDYDGCVEPHIEHEQPRTKLEVCDLWKEMTGRKDHQGIASGGIRKECLNIFVLTKDWEFKKDESMVVELTAEEIALIAVGFEVAQQECCLPEVLVDDWDCTKTFGNLIEKLGITYDERGHVKIPVVLPK